ncbi:D-glucuronyl C5-epimerase family protein [bacterium]|nr:D-glucuronyl C5-epimerase family protein [bacterium]
MTNEASQGEATQDAEQTLCVSYPFDWQGIDDFSYQTDSEGLPKVDWGHNIGLRYSPITIAQFGLYHLRQHVKNQSEESLQKAFKCAHWLASNSQRWRDDMWAWIYDYDLYFYGPRAPWISAMAQGEGISLLLRAYQLNQNEKWLDITRCAIRVFFHPVPQGGVAASFPDGGLAFEEFPTEPASLVLNGNMFAMLGLHDYARFWQDKAASELFDRAVEGLKGNLHRYDTGYWNLYDLHPTNRLASPMYIEVHVRLLNILATLTAEPTFERMAAKWKRYPASPVSRIRWLFRKSWEKFRLRDYSRSFWREK